MDREKWMGNKGKRCILSGRRQVWTKINYDVVWAHEKNGLNLTLTLPTVMET